MKEHPIKGDWILKVQEDLTSLGTSLDKEEENIFNMTKECFKRNLKEDVRKIALTNLEDLKKGHDKVRHIKHLNLNQPQAYLVSN